MVSVDNGVALLSHPIDVQFECSSIDGWPLFICEVKSFSVLQCTVLLYDPENNYYVGMGQVFGSSEMFLWLWERVAAVAT